MWDFIVSYTIPIFMILFLSIILIRTIRQNKKDGKPIKSLVKAIVLTVVITLLVLSAISYMIISMTA